MRKIRKPQLTARDLGTRIESLPAREAEALIAGALTRSDYQPTAEERARAAVEALNEGPLTDEEWAEAERNLDAIMIIALDWRENPVP